MSKSTTCLPPSAKVGAARKDEVLLGAHASTTAIGGGHRFILFYPLSVFYQQQHNVSIYYKQKGVRPNYQH